MDEQRTPFTWDPEVYNGFAGLRARPFLDLVGRVHAAAPRVVVDLGCGPGTMTAVLARRWPEAEVVGLDDSAAMLEQARASLDAPDAPPNLRFEHADAARWRPGPEVDVVVSNALLQWLPEHPRLIADWLAALPAGAWFAAQVPHAHHQPSHAQLTRLAAEPEFAAATRGAASTDTVLEPGEYVRLFARAGWRADVWESEFQQVLEGEDPVVRWTSGSLLRPVLAALEGWDAEHGTQLRAAYLDRYTRAMREAYPPLAEAGTADGGPLTVFPFRRLFLVGQAPTG